MLDSPNSTAEVARRHWAIPELGFQVAWKTTSTVRNHLASMYAPPEQK